MHSQWLRDIIGNVALAALLLFSISKLIKWPKPFYERERARKLKSEQAHGTRTLSFALGLFVYVFIFALALFGWFPSENPPMEVYLLTMVGLAGVASEITEYNRR